MKRKNTEDNPCSKDNPSEVNQKTELDEKVPHSEERSQKIVKMSNQETDNNKLGLSCAKLKLSWEL